MKLKPHNWQALQQTNKQSINKNLIETTPPTVPVSRGEEVINNSKQQKVEDLILVKAGSIKTVSSKRLKWVKSKPCTTTRTSLTLLQGHSCVTSEKVLTQPTNHSKHNRANKGQYNDCVGIVKQSDKTIQLPDKKHQHMAQQDVKKTAKILA